MTDFDHYYTETAMPALKEFAGDAVTYVDPDDGTETAATALLGDERTEDAFDGKGNDYRRTLQVMLFKNDVPAVSKRGSLTIDGVEWPIDAILSETSVQTMVQLLRIESREVSRPGYRGK